MKKNKIFIYLLIIGLIAIHFLLFAACGTKTKNVTEVQAEKQGREDFKAFDSVKKTEEFLLTKTEEKQKELEQQFREENKTEETETTVTEVVEVVSPEPVYMELSNGKFLNINNGRITATKTTTTGTKKDTKIIEAWEKRAEKQQKTIDSLNSVIISKNAGIEAAKEYLETQKSTVKEVKKTGWKPGFFFWFWIILILLLIIIVWFGRKWIGTTFPFLQVFKFFR